MGTYSYSLPIHTFLFFSASTTQASVFIDKHFITSKILLVVKYVVFDRLGAEFGFVRRQRQLLQIFCSPVVYSCRGLFSCRTLLIPRGLERQLIIICLLYNHFPSNHLLSALSDLSQTYKAIACDLTPVADLRSYCVRVNIVNLLLHHPSLLS